MPRREQSTPLLGALGARVRAMRKERGQSLEAFGEASERLARGFEITMSEPLHGM